MTTARSTVAFSAPCPVCEDIVTWLHHPSEPFPQPRCPKPTCRTAELVEK